MGEGGLREDSAQGSRWRLPEGLAGRSLSGALRWISGSAINISAGWALGTGWRQGADSLDRPLTLHLQLNEDPEHYF